MNANYQSGVMTPLDARLFVAQRAHLLDVLRVALARGAPSEPPPAPPARTWDPSYPIWRLLHAWYGAGPEQKFGPDLLVLLRQVVMWHGVPLAFGELHERVAAALAERGETVGLRMSFGHLEVIPFAPEWLDSGSGPPVVDGAPTQRRPDERIEAEAYLVRLGFDYWNSRAQKEGVWRALTAPPRSTTLVALPTGAGKSLCFQAIAARGTGLTVVVVPTVALAIDHWKSARQVLGPDDPVWPLYYAADDPAQPAEVVLQTLRDGRCRLLFTSPEACVSGRLRPVLGDMARSGRLDALVIDEAHLADSWGMYFRVDFQVLAAVRRQWLAAPNARLKTLLLSATFTPDCRKVLRRLFADTGGVWTEIVSQRLRPEMTYFAKAFLSASTRENAIMECAWRLPRPAILYTTTRADARSWTARLRAEGFERIACFDGNTPVGERRELLDQWRTNRIDLMVATSAFGMGVDKQDVRAIVHACLPEDLHRYYQEVGRSGRDGASSACLLLPLFPRDREVADGLAPRLLKPETLARRWSALWDTHRPVSDLPNTWRLRTDARPANLYGADTGRRNIAWNKRLLLQLARAGLLDIVDVGQAQPERSNAREGITRNDTVGDEWKDESDGDADVAGLEFVEEQHPEIATVRAYFAPNAADVDLRISRMRDEELESMRRGLDYMLEYVEGATCIGRILRRLYGAETALACGGCPACRRGGHRILCPPLPVPRSKPSAPARLVIAQVPSPVRDDQRRRFQMLVRRLAGVGVNRFFCSADAFPLVLRAVDGALEGSVGVVYRVDALDSHNPPTCAPWEAVAVVHVGTLVETALQFHFGARVLHLITSETPHLDLQNRRPLELDGVPYYPSPDFWKPEI